MHSKIFQIEEEKVNESNYISELDMDNFVGRVADYVSSRTNREKDIEWLIETLDPKYIQYDRQKQSITFLTGFKENYFKPRYETLKKIVENLSLEEFMDYGSDELYLIQETITNRFGFYVYQEDLLEPFDEFVRGLVEDIDYYIGNTLDYHF